MSAEELAFTSRPDCPLPPIPKIPADLVEDCLVPDPPEPLYEGFEFPPIPVPPPIGCAEIFVTGSISYDDPPGVTASVNNRDGDQCFPILDLDISIPCVCSSINPNGSVRFGGPSISFTATHDKTATPDECSCDIDLDLEVQFPCICPTVEAKSKSGFGGGGAKLEAEAAKNEGPGNCSCDIDLNLDVQFPCVCTSIEPLPPKYSYFGPKVQWEKIEKNSENSSECMCETSLELDVKFPCICTEVDTITTSAFFGPPSLTMTAEPFRLEESSECVCALNFDVEVSFPCICTDLTGYGTVNIVSGATPTLDIEVTPHNNTGTDTCECLNELTIELTLPESCTTINGSSITGKVFPGGGVTGWIGQMDDDPCSVQLNDLEITVTGVTAEVTVTREGTGDCVHQVVAGTGTQGSIHVYYGDCGGGATAGCMEVYGGTIGGTITGVSGTISGNITQQSSDPCALEITDLTIDLPDVLETIGRSETGSGSCVGDVTINSEGDGIVVNKIECPGGCDGVTGSGAFSIPISPDGTFSGELVQDSTDPCKLKLDNLVLAVEGFLTAITVTPEGSGDCITDISLNSTGDGITVTRGPCPESMAKYC